jgi:hypothetical protein
MKRMQGLLMGGLVLVVAGLAQAGESYHVLKIKSWDKDVAYEVMADADFKKVLDDQQKQAKHVSKAADLAKTAWQSEELTRGKPFPQKVLVLPTYTKVGTFSKKEQADEKLYRCLDNQREDQKAKGKSAGKGKAKADPRDAESESRQRAARTLFETKLSEVIEKANKPPVAVEAEPNGGKMPVEPAP